MTTIAWDGTTLAADKRANLSGTRMTVTKIRKGRRGNLVGIAGTFSLAESIFAWLCDGAARPEAQADAKDWCHVIEITPAGECWRHERHGKYRVEDRFAACGSGMDVALGALACGKTSAEAVAIAARFDINTGDGVDTLSLAPRTARRPKGRKA